MIPRLPNKAPVSIICARRIREVNRERWRAFYAEYLAIPVAYGLLAAGVFSVMGFLMTWGGWRGKFKPWGDPIPFTDALARVPEMGALAFVVTFIVLTVSCMTNRESARQARSPVSRWRPSSKRCLRRRRPADQRPAPWSSDRKRPWIP
jgi:hypothetical protein